ncbi:hypothetical protein [Paenibacillus sp. KN14-4R]|uniref:hypothetical protein n=1 Tax=Paenibacillus sp. KN14-4R TaxID=3445773 RepID=UPI003FA09026
MEKKLIKGAIYGFIIGLCLAILFISDTETVNHTQNTRTIIELPLRTYILKILRFAIASSFAVVIGLGLVHLLQSKENGGESFLRGYVKSFVVTLVAIVIGGFVITRLF